jgi:hypothetical protein
MMENYGISDHSFYKMAKNLEMQLYPTQERNAATFKIAETIVNIEYLTALELELKRQAAASNSTHDRQLGAFYGSFEVLNRFYERYSDKDRANEAFASATDARFCVHYYGETLFKPKATRMFWKGFVVASALFGIGLLIYSRFF